MPIEKDRMRVRLSGPGKLVAGKREREREGKLFWGPKKGIGLSLELVGLAAVPLLGVVSTMQ